MLNYHQKSVAKSVCFRDFISRTINVTSLCTFKSRISYNLKFSDKIQENFRLKVRSKQLLEIAKKGVEKAIESEEETVIKWVNKELERIGIEL